MLNKFQRNCVAIAVTQAISMPSLAATIVVNSSSDTTTSSTCTLRSAIVSANTDTSVDNCSSGSGDDTITVLPSATSNSTVSLNAELPTITSTLSIVGTGKDSLTVSGNNNSRIISIASDGNLTVSDMTLTEGYASNGGAISVDNGILNINNSLLSSNVAVMRSSGGGAITISGGTATITGSVLSGNSSTGFSSDGGAIVISGGTLSINNSTLSDNFSDSGGGAIQSNSSLVTITNSTLYDNFAAVDGGGVSSNSSSVTTISNSTFYRNHGLYGGAIANSASTTTITNSSIINNRITLRNFAGVFGDGGGVFSSNSSTTNISNSIISGNRARSSQSPAQELSLTGTSTLRHNVLGRSTYDAANSFDGLVPDQTNILATRDGLNLERSQIFLPLGDNGGPTRTHALPVRSPALNTGDNFICAETDQRGEMRDDGACDIGAFESDLLEEEPFFVIPLDDGKAVIFSL